MRLFCILLRLHWNAYQFCVAKPTVQLHLHHYTTSVKAEYYFYDSLFPLLKFGSKCTWSGNFSHFDSVNEMTSKNTDQPLYEHYIWATSWQNQQNDPCTQRRLRSARASAQSEQFSLCVQWVAQDPSFLQADSEDSDETGWMPRLIWVFAGCTCPFVGFVMRRLI